METFKLELTEEEGKILRISLEILFEELENNHFKAEHPPTQKMYMKMIQKIHSKLEEQLGDF